MDREKKWKEKSSKGIFKLQVYCPPSSHIWKLCVCGYKYIALLA